MGVKGPDLQTGEKLNSSQTSRAQEPAIGLNIDRAAHVLTMDCLYI